MTDDNPQGIPPYLRSDNRVRWEANGFVFYGAKLPDLDRLAKDYEFTACRAFEPSAISFSTIYWAPNHVRAWRRSVYEAVGGHDASLDVADDHDLLCRTYLETRCHHIAEPLYLYRYTSSNTSVAQSARIRELTWAIHDKYLSRLALRESQMRGLYAINLTTSGNYRAQVGYEGYTPAGNVGERGISFDPTMVSQRWPFEDNSLGVIRAVDVLAQCPDKLHVMNEIWRCLADGGWLLSETPSSTGRGGDMDPRNKSRWNSNTFWYWTRGKYWRDLGESGRSNGQGALSGKFGVPFESIGREPGGIQTYFPTRFHETNDIPYVRANLVALKGITRMPGEILE